MIGEAAGTREIHGFCSRRHIYRFFHIFRVKGPEDEDVNDHGKDKNQGYHEYDGGHFRESARVCRPVFHYLFHTIAIQLDPVLCSIIFTFNYNNISLTKIFRMFDFTDYFHIIRFFYHKRAIPCSRGNRSARTIPGISVARILPDHHEERGKATGND